MVRPGGEWPERWLKLTFQLGCEPVSGPPPARVSTFKIYLLHLKSHPSTHNSQADSICNCGLRHHLLSLNGPLSVCQTESPRTGRPSCARWSTWSTMTTLVMRHRLETPCEGHLTGRCTTSAYPSLWSCRRETPVNPLSEYQWDKCHLLLFEENNISIRYQFNCKHDSSTQSFLSVYLQTETLVAVCKVTELCT